MLLSIGNYVANYYKTYSFNSSDKNAKNAVDATKISKEKFNISNLTNALDSMGNSISDDFPVVTSVDLYSKNIYKMSQISPYDDLSKNLYNRRNNLSGFFSGSADFTGMYNVLGLSSQNNSDLIKSIFKKSDTDNRVLSRYKDYLSENETGSIFDILA